MTASIKILIQYYGGVDEMYNSNSRVIRAISSHRGSATQVYSVSVREK